MAKSQPNYDHNLQVLKQLRPGDLIEFPRKPFPYSHWGVYMGDGKVIHLTGLGNEGLKDQSQIKHVFVISGAQFQKAEVRIDDFWDIVAGCEARKNNDKDKMWKPFAPEEILKRAQSRLGVAEYSLKISNCEHFANWCRYGKSQSDQVDNAVKAVKDAAGALGGAGLVASGAIASSVSKPHAN